MKFNIIFLLSMCFSINIYSQISIGGSPPSMYIAELKSSYQVPIIILPEIDTNRLLEEDKERNDSLFRIGKLIPVNIDIISRARESVLDSTYLIYRLKVISRGAKSIQLSFDEFKLPRNSKLYVYSPDYKNIAGGFSMQNNRDDEKFSTQPIIGDELIIEAIIPFEKVNEVKLKLDYVCHNYKEIEKIKLKNTISTDCFLDVHCDNFISNQIRSVMKWSFYDTQEEGNYVCSCVLMNQDVPKNDLKYYVLTAEHCGGHANLSNAIFYFNYQERDCNVGNGTLLYSTLGATMKAKRSIYDMYLMELTETPPEYYNIHFAGWDRSDYSDLWPWVFGIHHPHGWVKKSSEGELALNTNLFMWRVQWDEYPTEGGSSGSPLFEDWDGRVIGQLSYSLFGDCDNLAATDKYGKLRKSWDASSSDKRLRSWLDPYGHDKIGIDGVDPCYTNINIANSESFYLQLRSAQNDYQPSNKVIIQAGNELATSGLISVETGAEYSFRAGNKIRLNSGFRVEAGGILHAEISSCANLKYSGSGRRSPTLQQGLTTSKIMEQNSFEILESEKTLIKLYPNPFDSDITIELLLSQKERITIRVINSIGKIIRGIDKEFEKGVNIEKYNLTDLPSGIYYISFHSNDFMENIKLIKK